MKLLFYRANLHVILALQVFRPPSTAFSQPIPSLPSLFRSFWQLYLSFSCSISSPLLTECLSEIECYTFGINFLLLVAHFYLDILLLSQTL
jgi:hypothetical protein